MGTVGSMIDKAERRHLMLVGSLVLAAVVGMLLMLGAFWLGARQNAIAAQQAADRAAAKGQVAATQAAAGKDLAQEVARACAQEKIPEDLRRLCIQASSVATQPPVQVTGPVGPRGPAGPTGPPGRGITLVECLPNGQWRIAYTDGTVQTGVGPCRAVSSTG